MNKRANLSPNEQLIRPLADTSQYERKSTIEKDFKGYIYWLEIIWKFGKARKFIQSNVRLEMQIMQRQFG